MRKWPFSLPVSSWKFDQYLSMCEICPVFSTFFFKKLFHYQYPSPKNKGAEVSKMAIRVLLPGTHMEGGSTVVSVGAGRLVVVGEDVDRTLIER